jgi:histidinol-phosphate aminotransferase
MNIRPLTVQTENIVAERKRLAEKLATIPVVEKIWPSDSNFLLVRVNDADSVYNKLISNNIIVRNKSRDVDGCLRITAGTRNENDRLISVLNKI